MQAGVKGRASVRVKLKKAAFQAKAVATTAVLSVPKVPSYKCCDNVAFVQ